MANITTCTDCGALYEAGSEEQANEPERWCVRCRKKRGTAVKREDLPLDWAMYPSGWPACPGCGDPALDGHITCGKLACDERGRR